MSIYCLYVGRIPTITNLKSSTKYYRDYATDYDKENMKTLKGNFVLF